MADKDIAIRIKIQGTGEQEKNLKTLNLQLDKLTKERNELNKAQKKNVISLEQASAKRAKLNIQIKATRNALRDTEQQILKNNGALRKTGGLTNILSTGFKKVGQSISSAFIGLFAIQQLIELTRKVIEVNRDFELQMSKVRAITGAAPEDFERLSKSALDLGRSTQFTATQVGTLQEEFAKLGFTTDEIIAAQEATLNLAIAAQTDLGNAATIVASTLRAYGEDASQATNLTDIMADAFTSTALDISKFETAMAIVGPVANTAGVSIAETTGQLGVLANAGIDASTAGTGLRNIYLDLAKSGLTLDQALTKIQTSTNKNATAMDLFGKRGATVATVLSDNIEQARELGVQFGTFEGEAAKMAETVGDTLDGSFKRLDSAVEGLFLSFQDVQSEDGGLKGLNNDIAEAINKVTDFLKETNGLNVALNLMVASIKAGSTPLRVLFQLIDAIVSIVSNLGESVTGTFKAIRDQFNTTGKTLGLLFNAIKSGDFSSIGDIISNSFKESAKNVNNYVAAQQKGFQVIAKEAIEFGNDTADILTGVGDAYVKVYDSIGAKVQDIQKKNVEGAKKSGEEQKKTQREITSVTQEELDKRKKLQKKREKEIADANKSILEKIRKIRGDISVLEINDEKEKQLKKLQVQLESDRLSIKMSKANQEIKNAALKALDDKYLLDKSAVEKKFNDEKVKADKAANDQILANRREVNNQLLDLASNATTTLINGAKTRADRQKDIALAGLQDQIDAGIITQEEGQKKREQIEREAFEKKKRLDLAFVAVELAKQIVSIQTAAAANPANAVTFGGAGVSQAAVLTGIAIANAGIQTAAILAQKYADGGLLSGPSHAQGGIPFTVGGQAGFEAEGGEAIINKKSTAMYAPLLSAINEAGGGVAFAKGGLAKPVSKFQRGGVASVQSSMMSTRDLEEKIIKGVTRTLKSIPVVNNAVNTADQAVKVSNIQRQANFG
jgi:hypothetical protein